jgi:hypothetical protein
MSSSASRRAWTACPQGQGGLLGDSARRARLVASCNEGQVGPRTTHRGGSVSRAGSVGPSNGSVRESDGSVTPNAIESPDEPSTRRGFGGPFSISLTVHADPTAVAYRIRQGVSLPATSEAYEFPSKNPHTLDPDIVQIPTSVTIPASGSPLI